MVQDWRFQGSVQRGSGFSIAFRDGPRPEGRRVRTEARQGRTLPRVVGEGRRRGLRAGTARRRSAWLDAAAASGRDPMVDSGDRPTSRGTRRPPDASPPVGPAAQHISGARRSARPTIWGRKNATGPWRVPVARLAVEASQANVSVASPGTSRSGGQPARGVGQSSACASFLRDAASLGPGDGAVNGSGRPLRLLGYPLALERFGNASGCSLGRRHPRYPAVAKLARRWRIGPCTRPPAALS